MIDYSFSTFLFTAVGSSVDIFTSGAWKKYWKQTKSSTHQVDKNGGHRRSGGIDLSTPLFFGPECIGHSLNLHEDEVFNKEGEILLIGVSKAKKKVFICILDTV